MKTKQIITLCLLAAFLAGFGLWSVLQKVHDHGLCHFRCL